LLKAIRSLPEREQDIVLAFLLERALVEGDAETRVPVGGTPSAIPPGFPGARMEVWPPTRWPEREAALILRRLADGETVDQVAAVLGLDASLLRAVLRDLTRRSHGSERLAGIFHRLAEGDAIGQAAQALGLTEDEVVAQLEPSEQLTRTVCAALVGRTALPGPAAGYLASSAQGPLRTMPVRFPEQLYQRLKDWCEQNNFPMAVVVRGVVERFLDEQQRRVA
jgi:hypothetical protein